MSRTPSHASPFLSAALAFGLAFAMLSWSPAAAQAQSVQMTVQIILGTDDGSGIPDELSQHADRLQTEFARFSGFSLVANHSFSLVSNAERALDLPGDDDMTIRFLGSQNSAYRLRISVPGGTVNVSSPPGGLFFVAGPTVPGGTLIFAIRTQ